jgi:hypothetical protein
MVAEKTQHEPRKAPDEAMVTKSQADNLLEELIAQRIREELD